MPSQIRQTDTGRALPAETPSSNSATNPLKNGTVLVNGKTPEQQFNVPNPMRDEARASGATKEAATSKAAEHRLEGQAQEIRLRSSESGNVFVNGKSPFRKDDTKSKCETPG